MDRIALVTGANRGLGFETARQLAAAGLRVIVSSRNGAKSREAAAALGARASALELDVADGLSIERALETVEREFGRVDVLVNNAGVFPDKERGALTVDAETVRATFETNTLGALRMAQAFAPLMRKHAYGRIVNVSSGLGTLHDMLGGFAAYRISKTALNAVTRMLAAELAGSGVLVNAVCPGWCRTEMGGADATRTPEEGARGIVQICLLPDHGPTGLYFRDGKQIDW